MSAPHSLLRTDLATLPTEPGVYLMRDAAGEVLYVGKATSLKNRVRQYFQGRSDGRAHVPLLVRKVTDVEVVVTRTEKEALILENNLIKKYRPRYNVRLKDDKTWLSVRIAVKERFPRVELARKWRKDDARYFGPYLQGIGARDVVALVRKAFPLRTCTDGFFRAHSGRPCLEYQIGNCSGPCAGRIDAEGYAGLVRQVVLLLDGRTQDLQDQVRAEMERASEELRFEDAAALRDRLRVIERLGERQRVQTGSGEDRDLWGLHREGDAVGVAVLPVRDGKMQDARSFGLRSVVEDDAALLAHVVQQVYESGPTPPPEVLLPIEVEAQETIAEWLSDRAGRKVTLLAPQRGEKVRLVELACANARVRLQAVDGAEARRERGLDELQRVLSLPERPRRIECYDMSNIQGSDPVGSMVTFADGAPDRAGYRVFKIKTVEGANDFASMREVLSRRFARVEQGWAPPDLVVIDGGRGQLRMAVEAAREAGFGGIPVCSLAKPDGDDGGANPDGVDRIFLPGRKNPVVLPPFSPALLVLQHVRDEAHRFGVHHHRKQRTKRTLATQVEAIPGVGQARGRALLRRFGSVKRIREASADEIAGLPGFGPQIAARILAALEAGEGRGTGEAPPAADDLPS
ncbi:excinuclease ABC subunit UvrC [Myxococcota bacterium]|nr:excinuclease ABC subunit UvrC [Myxococcota bacterium]